MKSTIILNLLAIITINPIINAHENHDHQIYSWSNSKNKKKNIDNNVNFEKLENKKNNAKIYNKAAGKNF